MAYTIEQLRAARQSALNAGDNEAAQELLQASVRLAASHAPREEYDATEGMGGFDKFRAGVGQGMTNVGRHVGNLVGLVDDETLDARKDTDADLLATGAGRAGSILGETAALAVPMAGATGAAVRAGGAVAKLVGGAVRRGAVEGAAQGAIMADPGERGAGAALGAGFGGILPAAAGTVGKVARGLKRTPEAEELLRRGVDLTPGQMNPGGVLNKFEEDLTSVPIAKQFVAPARDQARNQWQKSVVREGAAPGAEIPDGEIHEMLEAAYKSFEPLYDQAKGFPLRLVKGKPAIITTGTDTPLEDVFATIVKRKSAPASARRTVATFLDDQLTKRIRSSEDLLELRSMIRNEARKVRSNPNSNVDVLARAELFDDADDAVTKALESQLPSDAMQALRVADSKYGTYKIIENAVGAAKDAPSGLLPHQLSTAVKAATDKGAYARGAGGDLRELAAQGRQTFDTRSPMTGARAATYALGAGALLTAPQVTLPVAGGLLAMTGTRAGRRIAQGATSPQQRLAAALKSIEKLPESQRNVAGRYARALLAAGTNE